MAKTTSRRKGASKAAIAADAKRHSKVAKQAPEPAGEWLTPTQISKEEGMPKHALQLIYGYIRTGKLEARDGGKSKLVDPEAARELIANRGSRGGARTPSAPRQPRAGRALPAGTIVSHEESKARTATERVPKGRRRVSAVTDSGRSLTYTHDGHKDQMWQTESLAKRIKDGTTQIESAAGLLAVVAYHWRMNDEEGLAKQLMDWCSGRVNEAGVMYQRLIGLAPKELTQEGEEEDASEGE